MKWILTIIASLIVWGGAFSQIPVEVFAGHKKTSFDLMFFRYLKHKEVNSRFLFFNRNRVSLDYRQTSKTYLPAFGFTEAISYNHPGLGGFAPVIVAQINGQGIYPKAGVQVFRRRKDLSFFSWVVCELLKDPNIDLFILSRYEPKLTEKLNLFSQVELFNSFPTSSTKNFNLIQRLRLGLRIREWQFGAAVDLSETGNKNLANTNNIGGFVRHEF